MTQVAVSGGMYWPGSYTSEKAYTGTTSVQTIDTTGEKLAMIGRVYLNGTSPKTMGGGISSIAFKCGAVTSFTTASDTLIISLQDVSSTVGPPMVPDETADTFVTLVGNVNPPTTNVWQTVSFTSATGTKSVAHGDLIALVFDMSNRTAGSVVIDGTYHMAADVTVQPSCAAKNSGTWTYISGFQQPMAYFTFSDGTTGWFDQCPMMAIATTSETIADAPSPDERGMMFQVPWDCYCNGVKWYLVMDATNNPILTLYDNPLGTPSSLMSLTLDGNQVGTVSDGRIYWPFTTPVFLLKNHDYCLALKTGAAGNAYLYYHQVADTNHRAFLPNGMQFRKATRNWPTGSDPGTAFAAESPALILYRLSLRLSSFDDGTGTGSGGGSRSRIQTGH